MKNYSYIILLLVLILIISCKENNDTLSVEDGFMDISSYDFDDGPLEVNGTWKFIWQNDNDEYILQAYDDSDWDTIKVPSRWNKKVKKSFGYCWLRLKINNNTNENLGLSLFNSNVAYKLYINGEPACKNGEATNTAEGYKSQNIPIYIQLPKTVYIVIAWKISNFSHAFGGVFICAFENVFTVRNDKYFQRGFNVIDFVNHRIIPFSPD